MFDEQVRLCADTLQRKTKEYTGDNTDRLSAFKTAATLQNCTPEQAVAEAEKNMVFAARLTQRGQTISSMKDLLALYTE